MTPVLVSLPPQRWLGIVKQISHTSHAAAGVAIGAHWSRFRQYQVLDRIPGQTAEGAFNAVYFQFVKADAETGRPFGYSLLLGAEVEEEAPVPKGFEAITGLGGDYLMFEPAGMEPAAIQQAWEAIDAYFAQQTEYRRTHAFDIKRYDPHKPQPLKIFVGVELAGS
jgi:predicted transcriptional regulator YdeE